MGLVVVDLLEAVEVEHEHRVRGASESSGRALVELTLHGLPAGPAALPRGDLAEGALSLVRQVEHRLDSLPALAERLDHERQLAQAESATAQHQLARPFKYAQQLTDARAEQARITQAIADRHAYTDPPPAKTETDGVGEDPVRATVAAAFPAPPPTRTTTMITAGAIPTPARSPVRGPARTQ